MFLNLLIQTFLFELRSLRPLQGVNKAQVGIYLLLDIITPSVLKWMQS